MKELMLSNDALVAKGLHRSVGLVTDARFSGFSHGALVGLVETVGRNWCEVTLVTSPSFQLAGVGTVSGALGTLDGSLARMSTGELLFSPFSPDFPMSLGEGVVSLAHGEEPREILVGTVTSLEESPGGLLRAGVVTPTANLDKLSQVYVVTAFREGT